MDHRRPILGDTDLSEPTGTCWSPEASKPATSRFQALIRNQRWSVSPRHRMAPLAHPSGGKERQFQRASHMTWPQIAMRA